MHESNPWATLGEIYKCGRYENINWYIFFLAVKGTKGRNLISKEPWRLCLVVSNHKLNQIIHNREVNWMTLMWMRTLEVQNDVSSPLCRKRLGSLPTSQFISLVCRTFPNVFCVQHRTIHLAWRACEIAAPKDSLPLRLLKLGSARLLHVAIPRFGVTPT